MAIIGQTQGLTIPAVGTAGTTYATQINAALEAIEDVLETKITPASLNINQAFSMNDQAIENVTYIELPSFAGTPLSSSLYVSGSDLYFKDGDGLTVRLTSAGAVNVSGVSGFGGDYTSDTASEARYHLASTDYYFLSDTGTATVAGMVAGKYTFLSELAAGYPYTAAATTFTRATGGSSYTATWPNAVPGGKRLVQIDGSGTITYENNVDGGFTVNNTGLTVTSGGATITAGGLTVAAGGAAITGNSSVVGTLTSSGALTVSSGGAGITGTCAVTGAITSTANVTATGQIYYNGDRYRFIPVSAATKVGSPGLFMTATSGQGPYAVPGTTEGAAICFGVPITDTENIDNEVKVYLSTVTAATISVRLTYVDISGGTFSLGAQSTVTASVGAATDYSTVFNLGADMSCASGGSVWTGNLPVFYTIKVWSDQTDTRVYGIGLNIKAG